MESHNNEQRFESGRERAEREQWPEATSGGTSFFDQLRDTTFLKYVALALIGIILLFLLLYFGTARVLPGNTLYAFKTDVLEEVMSFFRIGAEAKANYQLTLMERRMHELIALKNDGRLNDETFAFVLIEIEDHRNEITNLIAAEEERGLTQEEVLVLLRDFGAYASAAEQVLEIDPAHHELEETIEDVRRRVNSLYDDKVEQFVLRADSALLKGYLDSLLNETAQLTEGRELSRELEDDIEDELDNVAEALTEANTTDAIIAASEARQYIVINDLLADLTIEEPPSSSPEGDTQGDAAATGTDTATGTEAPMVE